MHAFPSVIVINITQIVLYVSIHLVVSTSDLRVVVA